jgi:hypothetical protein
MRAGAGGRSSGASAAGGGAGGGDGAGAGGGGSPLLPKQCFRWWKAQVRGATTKRSPDKTIITAPIKLLSPSDKTISCAVFSINRLKLSDKN